MRTSFARTVTAVLVLLVMLVQGTWVLASTTGGLQGVVTDAQSGQPIRGAAVAVASVGQNGSTKTDDHGHYSFLSLAPDTYTVTVNATGYDAISQPGITVTADQTQTLSFTPQQTLKRIGSTRSRASSDLVKPGQTADVYSIGSQLTQNTQAFGGGGMLYQTFAALQSVPGVYVPQGTNYGQNTSGPFIRGGDYDQVGYEYDGIPVNRAFDNYVSNTQGITGQQELQVYTGGISAGSAGEGLSGYINQVIKSGTYPATANAEGVLGFPSFYHYLRGEYGGASPSRNFSYYVGSTGWNQSLRTTDQFDGGSQVNDLLYVAYGGIDSRGTIQKTPFGIAGVSPLSTRETTANVHFGIPHRNGDGGRDDIQLLGSIGFQYFLSSDSFNDYGGVNDPSLVIWNGGPGPYPWPTTQIANQPIYSAFDPSRVQTYGFPSAPNGALFIDPNMRGRVANNNGIFKAQYQKNFGSKAYARIYGYTNFSSWITNDAPALYVPFTLAGSLDYELTTHTRGVALEYANQLSSKHLLQGSASYTFANVVRANNNTVIDPGYIAQLMDASGRCYSPGSGAPANCYRPNLGNNSLTGIRPGDLAAMGGVLPGITGTALANGATYKTAYTGYAVTYNTVAPKFSNVSLDDQWQVSDRLKLDLGLRFNNYIYQLSDTGQQALTGGSNDFAFANFNREHCYDPATRVIRLAPAPSYACPAGMVHTNLSNRYAGTVASTSLEPRVSGTYTLSPYDVIRFSGGKYSQPVNSAFVQYNRAGDLPSYTANNFFKYGFDTPRHDTTAQFASNYDISYEKRLRNAPLSFSFTPFLRTTRQQNQKFYLDPTTNFVSGINVGALRAYGYELLARYGDFNRDGISAQASFAYTNSKIRYSSLPGTNQNIIDQMNQSLLPGYNGLTSAGGGSPCYTPAGAGTAQVGSACPAGTIGNPYYNSPLQQPLDRNAYYDPYTTTPAAASGLFAAGSNTSYNVPYVFSLVTQYRKNGWRFVPTFQYDSGFTYGNPFQWVGYDPSGGASCFRAGQPDPVRCAATGNLVFRPNPYTGKFDNLGQFKSPGTFTVAAQVSKDLSKRATATLIVANLYRHCFTRGYAWEQGGSQACGYFSNAAYAAGGTFLGNATTPGLTLAKGMNDPFAYAPALTGQPLNAYFSLQVKM